MSNKKVSDKDMTNSDISQNTAPINEQQLHDDEAFIDSLYEEVGSGKLNQAEPSEILDKRIINAAQQAISPQSKVKKKPVRLTWFSGLATAASLTLVVSLVVQQQGQILPPADYTVPVMNVQPSAAPLNNEQVNNEQTIVTEIMSDERQENRGQPAVAQTKARLTRFNNDAEKLITQSLTTAARSSTYTLNDGGLQQQKSKLQQDNASLQTKQSSGVIESIFTTPPPTRLSQQKVAKMGLSAPPPQKQSAESTIKAANKLGKEDKKQHNFPPLSLAVFQQYLAQNKTLQLNKKMHWSLVAEQKSDYLITLYQTDKTAVRYRLNKGDFIILTSTLVEQEKSVTAKSPLSAIQLKDRKNAKNTK